MSTGQTDGRTPDRHVILFPLYAASVKNNFSVVVVVVDCYASATFFDAVNSILTTHVHGVHSVKHTYLLT